MATPTEFPPSRIGRPHIRLNSNTTDLLQSDGSPSSSLRPPKRFSARSLLSKPSFAQSLGPSLKQQPSDNSLYTPFHKTPSSEHLLPPKPTSRSRRPLPQVRYDPSSPRSRSPTSRRSSWSSVSSRDSRYDPVTSPFDDSHGTSSDEDVNTQTVAKKFNIQPGAGLLLYPEDVEKDDWLHNPDPGGKEPRDCNLFSKRGAINVGSLILMTLGVMALFIGYPVITFVERYIEPNNYDCKSDSTCITADIPLLKNVRTGLIDPDTPKSAMTRVSHDGVTQELVFSDEFNTAGRAFYHGDDPYFEAVDLWYGVTQDLEWYDPDAITTQNGTLTIRFDKFPNHDLSYRSGMLQSWNQLCFKGGHLEASISLPGRGDVSGFWPGFWAMGNLGRPGYAATTDGLWPYSYWDHCDAGITANQSQTDGISWLPGMRLPACTCVAADHPSPGKSRGAPEIDALEASVASIGTPPQEVGSASQSFQIAPFDIWYQPNYDFVAVYDLNITHMNPYRGGPYQQAMSGVTALNNAWYDGGAYQTYGFDYTPGDSGQITWNVGSQSTWRIDARAVGSNGNIGQRIIPQEPMALILNLGMGSSFAWIDQPAIDALMPATMRVDWIRIYQAEGHGEMTCDPEGYPTTAYIKDHPKAYRNAQATSWSGAGYEWPNNTLVNACKA